MQPKISQKPYSNELTKLLGKASSYILKARAIKARKDGDFSNLIQFFVQAAELEEEAAQRLEAEGHAEDVYISLVSVASCYQQAKHYEKVRQLFQQVLERSDVPAGVRAEVEHLISECKQDVPHSEDSANP